MSTGDVSKSFGGSHITAGQTPRSVADDEAQIVRALTCGAALHVLDGQHAIDRCSRPRGLLSAVAAGIDSTLMTIRSPQAGSNLTDVLEGRFMGGLHRARFDTRPGRGELMAEMFPRELLADEVKSHGERKVFDRLRDDLPEPWQAYHSVSWVARDHASGASTERSTSSSATPSRESSAWRSRAATSRARGGSWYTGPHGAQTQIKDPFTQALDHRYDLERHIIDASIADAQRVADRPRHRPARRDRPRARARARRAARADHRSDRPTRSPTPRSSASSPITAARARSERPPGLDGAAALRKLLVPTVMLRVPLAEEIVEEEVALIELTEEQGLLLARMGRTPRLAVTGCAGSGKTMLAVEHAKRLAAGGTKVLFVCFNKALQQHLRDRERTSGVDFFTFHGLCTHLAKRAEIKLPTGDLP